MIGLRLRRWKNILKYFDFHYPPSNQNQFKIEQKSKNDVEKEASTLLALRRLPELVRNLCEHRYYDMQYE